MSVILWTLSRRISPLKDKQKKKNISTITNMIITIIVLELMIMTLSGILTIFLMRRIMDMMCKIMKIYPKICCKRMKVKRCLNQKMKPKNVLTQTMRCSILIK